MAAVQSPKLEAHLYKRFVAGHLSRVSLPAPVDQSWIFSREAPGPCVEYKPEVEDDDARALADWYESYSKPDALAPFEATIPRQIEAQA